MIFSIPAENELLHFNVEPATLRPQIMTEKISAMSTSVQFGFDALMQRPVADALAPPTYVLGGPSWTGSQAVVCKLQQGHPLTMPFDSGWDVDPSGRWGSRIRVSPMPTLYFQTGIFQVNPTIPQEGNGWVLEEKRAQAENVAQEERLEGKDRD